MALQQHAVVIGAGPAGCATAMSLARKGFKVDVFERRGPPMSVQGPHSYPMVINSRGCQTIQQLGARLPSVGPDAMTQKAAFRNGVPVMAYPADATWGPDKGSLAQLSYLVDRGSLAKELHEAAETMFPGTIQFHFNSELAEVDFSHRKARFQSYTTTMHAAAASSTGSASAAQSSTSSMANSMSSGSLSHASTSAALESALLAKSVATLLMDRPGGLNGASSSGRSSGGSGSRSGNRGTSQTLQQREVEVQYDLLVGADGASSRLRSLMEGEVPGFTTRVLYDSTGTYKTFHGLQRLPEVEGFLDGKPGEYLQFMQSRGRPWLVLYRQRDGTTSGLATRVNSWDDPKALADGIRAYGKLPDAWIQEIVRQLMAQQPSLFGKTVQCSQLHGPRTVLIGDAGHAVTSQLGQGCNMALESVHMFDSVLDACGKDLDKAVEEFSRVRVPDVHAFQEMELSQVIATTPDKHPYGPLRVLCARLVMLLPLIIGFMLCKALPSIFKMPYLFAVLRDCRIPFRQAWRNLHMQAGTLLAGLVALLAILMQSGMSAVAAAFAARGAIPV